MIHKPDLRRYCVAALLLIPVLASAEDGGVLQQLNLNGSLRAGYYGASRSLDNQREMGTRAQSLSLGT